MYRNFILKTGLVALLCTSGFSNTNAQMKSAPTKKPYFSTGIDGYILSTTLKQHSGQSTTLSTPRFTGFVNVGVNLNYDFNKNVGLFTGLNVKNIGFIEKYSTPDSTVKRRVYTFGIPLALKLGDVKYGSYFIVGGGIDFPFNYREKGFIKRGDKQKFNEWFSSRTPAGMPYVFIGAHLRPLLTVKLQYYPGNFMNPDFETVVPAGLPGVYPGTFKPYKDYDVKLIMLTLGFDISYYPKK